MDIEHIGNGALDVASSANGAFWIWKTASTVHFGYCKQHQRCLLDLEQRQRCFVMDGIGFNDNGALSRVNGSPSAVHIGTGATPTVPFPAGNSDIGAFSK